MVAARAFLRAGRTEVSWADKLAVDLGWQTAGRWVFVWAAHWVERRAAATAGNWADCSAAPKVVASACAWVDKLAADSVCWRAASTDAQQAAWRAE
jgi:hypothetical protein